MYLQNERLFLNMNTEFLYITKIRKHFNLSVIKYDKIIFNNETQLHVLVYEKKIYNADNFIFLFDYLTIKKLISSTYIQSYII